MFQNKPKVNLLTFNSALSYGAVLQTYALMKAIEKLDCDVEIIDFRAPFLPPIPTGLWSLKVNYNINRFKKELLFRKFRNEYLTKKTKAIYSLKALKKHPFNADYYVVGSDQVWNPDITKKYSLTYFFDFIKGNKISYAASFGKEVWSYPGTFTREIKDLLRDFKAISVRERQAIDLAYEKFGVKSISVLDPTLLNPDFQEILPDFVNKNQIAAISVNNDPSFLNTVSAFQLKLSIPAYALDLNKGKENVLPVPFPSVNGWIRYIAESSFIITDSFHGVAFSIIFRKNFVVINANPKRFVRINDLLNKLQLENRIIHDISEINSTEIWKEQINYNKVYEVLNVLRNMSLDFLRRNLDHS